MFWINYYLPIIKKKHFCFFLRFIQIGFSNKGVRNFHLAKFPWEMAIRTSQKPLEEKMVTPTQAVGEGRLVFTKQCLFRGGLCGLAGHTLQVL